MANFFKTWYLPYFYSYFKFVKPPTSTSGPNVPRGVIQRWRFFSLAPFFNLNRLIKHHNILRNTNLNNRRNETNIDISLRVSNTNHLKLVRIYLPNPVFYNISLKVCNLCMLFVLIYCLNKNTCDTRVPRNQDSFTIAFSLKNGNHLLTP